MDPESRAGSVVIVGWIGGPKTVAVKWGVLAITLSDCRLFVSGSRLSYSWPGAGVRARWGRGLGFQIAVSPRLR